MKQAVGIAVALLITAATLAYSLWNSNLPLLWETLRTGRHWVALPFVVVLTVFYITNAQRWAMLLRPFGRFSTRELMPSMMIGFAGNNVLPLRVGELIRVYLFSKDLKQPRSGVLMTLVLERILDLIGILLCFGIGLSLLTAAPVELRITGFLAAGAIALCCVALLLFVRYQRQAEALWLRVAAAFPQAVRDRGMAYFEEFGRALMPLRSPGVVSVLLIQSVGRWMLACTLAWLSIYAYGEAVSFPLAMVVLGVTAFAVSLPSAPGFVGPIQAAFVFALTPFGIAQETALAASFLFLLGHWIPVTGVGVLMLANQHLTFVQLRRAVGPQQSVPAEQASAPDSRPGYTPSSARH